MLPPALALILMTKRRLLKCWADRGTVYPSRSRRIWPPPSIVNGYQTTTRARPACHRPTPRVLTTFAHLALLGCDSCDTDLSADHSAAPASTSDTSKPFTPELRIPLNLTVDPHYSPSRYSRSPARRVRHKPTAPPQHHHSLPARPPPPANPLPTFKSDSKHGTSGPTKHAAFTAFKPRSVATATPSWQAQPTVSAPPAPPSGFQAPQPAYPGNGYSPATYSQQQPYYPQSTNGPYTQATPPQIRNPFPLPGQTQNTGAGRGGTPAPNANFDPEYEAQIAQWQSAYASKDDPAVKGRGTGATASGTPVGGRTNTSTPVSNFDSATHSDGGVAIASGADKKEMTVVRSGGGQSWEDPTLLEWNPAHFRIFVGNLAGEVTDDSLFKAFSRYSSVSKARVIRDKRTTKSKGFGFVSFADGDDYFNAAKEMQGKYIGSHPVIIRRANSDVQPVVKHDKKHHGKKGKGSGNKDNGNANTGAGVHKKQPKTKGGIKLLG